MILVLAVLAHYELDENQFSHVTYAVEWQAEFFLPNRVESVILDDRCPERDGARRRHRRRRRVR